MTIIRYHKDGHISTEHVDNIELRDADHIYPSDDLDTESIYYGKLSIHWDGSDHVSTRLDDVVKMEIIL